MILEMLDDNEQHVASLKLTATDSRQDKPGVRWL
jgi:hypothetical protein